MSYISLKRGTFSVKELCRTLGVTEAGYYKHLRKPYTPSKTTLLLAQIYDCLKEDPENSNYGVRRIYDYLRIYNNYEGSLRTIYRICRENNLIICRKSRPNGITKADGEAQKSDNLIKQDFTAEAPNAKWLTDITEVPCFDGKLYLAAILDCYDGTIVGYHMDDNMRASLCTRAFKNACYTYSASGMILHSDRGSQFTSTAFRTALAAKGAIQSMSSVGRCYDNARMESFFATLKKEKLYRIDTMKMTQEMVKTIIFRYIQYDNHRRIYSTNDGLPPLSKRALYHCTVAA